MKNMKKLWAALLALAMTFSLAACGGTSDEDAATDDQPTGEEVSGDTAPESDVAYIQDKGTLVVGITYFAPMDYKEEGSDEWIGFDADLAKLFAESLGSLPWSSRRSPGTTRWKSWTPGPSTACGMV